IGDAVDPAESPAAGDLRIEIELRILAEAQAEEERCGQGDNMLGIVPKTQRALIGSVERAVPLADGCGLIVEIPTLGLGHGASVAARTRGRCAVRCGLNCLRLELLAFIFAGLLAGQRQ